MFVPGSRRRKYLNDYQINEKGNYEYSGKCYRWAKPAQRGQILLRLWILNLAAMALTIGAGLIPAPGVSVRPILLISYAASAALCVLCCITLFRMTDEKDPLRDHVFDASVKKLPRRWLLCGAASLIGAAAEIIYYVPTEKGASLAFALVFSLLQTASAILVLFCRKILTSLEWIPVDGKNLH